MNPEAKERGISLRRDFSQLLRARTGVPYLRHSPRADLSEVAIGDWLVNNNFFDREFNENGTGIAHVYVKLPQYGDNIILDEATELMWQQSGSLVDMNFGDALKYVEKLNIDHFSGFSDWRLPTLEEAMSLVEPKEYRDLYIDPIFDQRQKVIWTADKESSSIAWVVYFYGGRCDTRHVNNFGKYVRAVRVETKQL